MLFVICAELTVMSFSFSSTTPRSSTKAPLVPEPSSLETTVIACDLAPESEPLSLLALLLLPHPVNANVVMQILLLKLSFSFSIFSSFSSKFLIFFEGTYFLFPSGYTYILFKFR